MIERSADRLRVTVPMVVPNAARLLAAGEAAFKQPVETVDLGAVTEADSSALAVMLAWLRLTAAQGRALQFVNLPAGVLALSDLYGIDEFLPLA